MKIKNDFIKIKTGKKEIELHNLILDGYLELYAESLLNIKQKSLEVCFVDCSHAQGITPEMITMDYDFILPNIELLSNQQTSNNEITTFYNYQNSEVTPDYSQWYGHQIYKIGFGRYDLDEQDYKLYAILDVEPYNIIVSSGKDFIIQRVDTVETDLEFYSNDVNYPYHLAPNGEANFDGDEYNIELAKLSSVGKGYNNTSAYITVPIEQLSASVTMNELDIEGISITPNEEEELYPSNQLYPSNSSVYPLKSQMRWIIYGFSVYKNDYDSYIDTGKKYYQSMFITETGNLSLKTKYERG